MKRILFLLLTLCPWLLRASLILPDVPITLRKIDLRNGKVRWSVRLPRHTVPYRCETYPGRVVVYLWPYESGEDSESKEPRSRVLFLKAETGRPALPFDTRDFVWEYDDPLLARSGASDPALDPRNELVLANGWVSHGVGALPWLNTGTNAIYFEHGRSKPVWAIALPEGAYNLSNWGDILVFRKSIVSNRQYVGFLYGQRAGEDLPAWEFKLPEDVPDRKLSPGGVIGSGPPGTSRSLQYVIGHREILVLGNGVLFALEPSTGKTLWRHAVSEDPLIKNRAVPFEYVQMLEVGDDLLLLSRRSLAKFTKASRSVTAVLRDDIYQEMLPVACDGFIYCLTAPVRR